MLTTATLELLSGSGARFLSEVEQGEGGWL
jgi:hypothetical protein